ncbi:helix-turn-helix transcriptional regulator [Christensenella minuta]|uniref:helix-turn-helix domain-containing protein n=1 Tax=Christensenella minuta TaxID=626937 RepID=UPI002A7F554D|nr:helix-turn-helix transcriptional regulator [Christensenella minuta]MDY3750534.1 helix-turn-helix transcriptional regulator [Christensenella minuta]
MQERIRKLCTENHISIAQLEKETSIANGTISKWGKADPKVGTVKKVADYFGVSIDFIVYGSSEIKEEIQYKRNKHDA